MWQCIWQQQQQSKRYLRYLKNSRSTLQPLGFGRVSEGKAAVLLDVTDDLGQAKLLEVLQRRSEAAAIYWRRLGSNLMGAVTQKPLFPGTLAASKKSSHLLQPNSEIECKG